MRSRETHSHIRQPIGLLHGAEPPPATTALGALLAHISGGADAKTFQPMNVNFGLFPPLPESGKRLKGGERGRARKKGLSERALLDLGRWLEGSVAIPSAA